MLAPIQSGDPVRAEAALSRLAEIAEQISEPGTDARTGRGWTYTINWVATMQAAAGAMVVLVAGAAVVSAVAFVLYAPTQGLTRFERELRSSAVVAALR
ncbi:hypothetical protein EBM89_20405 [Cellulomonas triticagri]|uniref:Uncharacterized protein n=1 Tax=Cellulomonas triticagri TaxID=2483352 RepID=A0A3M2IIK4_9CELL|nr:hypothetical protein EBM89_20405 [Cellulomonas triticagri]